MREFTAHMALMELPKQRFNSFASIQYYNCEYFLKNG